MILLKFGITQVTHSLAQLECQFLFLLLVYTLILFRHPHTRSHRGHDRMVVGFTTTYAISAYHHWCELESRSGRGVQRYVIKFVIDFDRSAVFSGFSGFLHQKNWPWHKCTWYTCNWNIVSNGVKHHQATLPVFHPYRGGHKFILM